MALGHRLLRAEAVQRTGRVSSTGSCPSSCRSGVRMHLEGELTVVATSWSSGGYAPETCSRGTACRTPSTPDSDEGADPPRVARDGAGVPVVLLPDGFALVDPRPMTSRSTGRACRRSWTIRAVRRRGSSELACRPRGRGLRLVGSMRSSSSASPSEARQGRAHPQLPRLPRAKRCRAGSARLPAGVGLR